MPCGMRHIGDDYDLICELGAATRAACELARMIKKTDPGNCVLSVFSKLSKPTLQWVREHEQVDYQRRKK